MYCLLSDRLEDRVRGEDLGESQGALKTSVRSIPGILSHPGLLFGGGVSPGKGDTRRVFRVG